MKKITHTRDALIWLHQILVKATPLTKVSPFVTVAADYAAQCVADDRECYGLSLEQWEPFMQELVKATKSGPYDNTMSVPLAAFISDLLADLATRGESGSVSREQMVLMAICALDWAEQFELVENKGGAVIKSSADFESAHGVRITVPVSPAAMLDLHYSIGC